jgi:hypothetical protein
MEDGIGWDGDGLRLRWDISGVEDGSGCGIRMRLTTLQ